MRKTIINNKSIILNTLSIILLVSLVLSVNKLTEHKLNSQITNTKICRVTNITQSKNSYIYTIADEDENLFQFDTKEKLNYDWLDVSFNNKDTTTLKDDVIITYEELK